MKGNIGDLANQDLARSGNFHKSRLSSICGKPDGNVQSPSFFGLAFSNIFFLSSLSVFAADTSMLCHDLWLGSHIKCAQWLNLSSALVLKTMFAWALGSKVLQWCGFLKKPPLDASLNGIDEFTLGLLWGSEPPRRFATRLERETKECGYILLSPFILITVRMC